MPHLTSVDLSAYTLVVTARKTGETYRYDGASGTAQHEIAIAAGCNRMVYAEAVQLLQIGATLRSEFFERKLERKDSTHAQKDVYPIAGQVRCETGSETGESARQAASSTA